MRNFKIGETVYTDLLKGIPMVIIDIVGDQIRCQYIDEDGSVVDKTFNEKSLYRKHKTLTDFVKEMLRDKIF